MKSKKKEAYITGKAKDRGKYPMFVFDSSSKLSAKEVEEFVTEASKEATKNAVWKTEYVTSLVGGYGTRAVKVKSKKPCKDIDPDLFKI